jgi:nicotinic acid mononucleotide adenylyltransferase
MWVADRQPPHKHVCGYEHRRLMVESAESAIKDNPAFMLSPREISHTSPD